MSKHELIEKEERDIMAITMLVFFALIAGVMLGYSWCWYHLGG